MVTTITLAVVRQSVVVRDAAGRPARLVLPRLACALRVGPERVKVDAWLDTGSPLTLVPQDSWGCFEPHIRWTDPAGGGLATRVAGGSFLGRRGWIEMAVSSADLRAELPPLPVAALFVQDGGALKQALVGLSGGVLAGRRLVVEPDLASARLEAA